MSQKELTHTFFAAKTIYALFCRENDLRTSSGKFWRVESCHPESSDFLGLWIAATSPITIDLLGLPLHSKAFSFLTVLRGSAVLAPYLAEGLMILQPDKMAPLYLSSAFFALSTIFSVVTTNAYVEKLRLGQA